MGFLHKNHVGNRVIWQKIGIQLREIIESCTSTWERVLNMSFANKRLHKRWRARSGLTFIHLDNEKR